MVCNSIIDKQEVISDLSDISKSTLELILPLFDYVKADIISKSIPMLEKKEFVYYLNGVFAYSDILKKYFTNGIKGIQEETISQITRQPIDKKKESDNKPWKARMILS